MNSFIIESFKRFSKVHFYTVRWDESEESETDRFIARFMDDENYEDELVELLTLIEDIGETRGAKSYLFSRFENFASALPPNFPLKIQGVEFSFPENRLRLYCVQLDERLVILFNGGFKESQVAQKSPDISLKFHEAQTFVKKIEKALREGDLIHDQEQNILTSAYGGDEIIIY